MLSLFFSKARTQTEQQAEVADSSQEGFEEGVDVRGLAVYIEYAGADPLPQHNDLPNSEEPCGWQEASSPTVTLLELE